MHVSPSTPQSTLVATRRFLIETNECGHNYPRVHGKQRQAGPSGRQQANSARTLPAVTMFTRVFPGRGRTSRAVFVIILPARLKLTRIRCLVSELLQLSQRKQGRYDFLLLLSVDES